jgi:hypothetical protein
MAGFVAMRTRLILAGLWAIASPALAAERVFAVGDLRIAQADILDARAQPAVGSAPFVLITLADPIVAQFAKLRAVAKGRDVMITLDGKTLGTLREPIEGDPTVQIPGGDTIAEAEALAKLISGKEPLRDSLEDNP